MPDVARRTRQVEEPIRLHRIEDDLFEWALLKKKVDADTRRMNLLRDSMMLIVADKGEVDEKGSLFLDVEPITVGDQTFGTIKRERRVSVSLDEDATETLLDSKGLLGRAQKTVVVLDHDEIYVLQQEGLITEAELDALFVERESWAFKPLAG